MKTAGSIIALVAGVISVFTGLITIFAGGFADAFISNLLGSNAQYIGICISLLVITFSILSLYAKTNKIPMLIILCSICGILFGGKLIALFMVLGIVGGILALANAPVLNINTPNNSLENPPSFTPIKRKGIPFLGLVGIAIVFVIIVIIIINISAQKKAVAGSEKVRNDLLKYGLIGEVNSFMETNYKAVDRFGEVVPDTFVSSKVTLFNKLGNISEIYNYNQNGEITDKQVYKYDSYGIKVAMSEMVLDSYYYDGRFKTIARESYDYDKSGYQISLNYYDNKDSLRNKYIYKNDARGNRIETRIYDNMGFLTEGWISAYDDLGNVIEENVYDSSGEYISKHLYKYSNSSSKVLSGEKGKLIEDREFNARNVLISTTRFSYDDAGNMVESNCIREDGTMDKLSYEYEYVRGSNWTKKIEFRNGVAQTIIERIFNKDLPTYSHLNDRKNLPTPEKMIDTAIDEVVIPPTKEAVTQATQPTKPAPSTKPSQPVKPTKPAQPEASKYTVVFDLIRVRDNPGLDGHSIGEVNTSDVVIYLNEKSNFTDTVTIKKKSYTSYWYKVKTPDNKVGWIIGAAIGK